MVEFVKLSPEEAAKYGILYSSKRSPKTAEIRARLTAAGVDVTITQAPEGGGGWQNSHRHERVVEITNVIAGTIIVVEQTPFGTLFFKRYEAGGNFKTTPGLAHNVYVFGGTVMSTLKLYDDPNGRDWIAVPELDQETVHLSADEARKLCLKWQD